MTRVDVPDPPHRTGADLLVLHALRCGGFAGLAGVSDATGLPEPDAESALIDLAVAGLVTHVPGDLGGWGLTEAGRAADAERIANELAATGARPVVAAAYDEFLVLNPELLDLCAAWQSRPADGATIPNDHTDAGYDSRVLDRLADLHRRAEHGCAELFATMLRFRRYRTRLAGALARARSGSRAHVTDSTDSYHTVWFQLHEDLLATLGIPRPWHATEPRYR
ncbi:transcriptional regulator [Streptomyces litchfieldiae]|uniref:Transcriptional regulator n=1 Tax=Streptomyces litchfieldiae TaxID=3075543 RepID=A0ABU2MWK7_9ACTN|nr:transcriptional regulator [Streptomyces sp. DSM 44938]MDT0345856.1 transcriptional regulator [Streptomyces sp. DSM 44938]